MVIVEIVSAIRVGDVLFVLSENPTSTTRVGWVPLTGVKGSLDFLSVNGVGLWSCMSPIWDMRRTVITAAGATRGLTRKGIYHPGAISGSRFLLERKSRL